MRRLVKDLTGPSTRTGVTGIGGGYAHMRTARPRRSAARRRYRKSTLVETRRRGQGLGTIDAARQTARRRIDGHENGDQRGRRRRVEVRRIARAGRAEGAEADMIATPVRGRAIARKPVAMLPCRAGDRTGRGNRFRDSARRQPRRRRCDAAGESGRLKNEQARKNDRERPADGSIDVCAAPFHKTDDDG